MEIFISIVSLLISGVAFIFYGIAYLQEIHVKERENPINDCR